MLVLTRKSTQSIMIGDDIEVTVVDIRGDKVRLGITAPREISVHRKEVYDAIRRENPALLWLEGVDFLETENDQLIAYVRRVPGNVLIVVVNLDPTAERGQPEDAEFHEPKPPVEVLGLGAVVRSRTSALFWSAARRVNLQNEFRDTKQGVPARG